MAESLGDLLRAKLDKVGIEELKRENEELKHHIATLEQRGAGVDWRRLTVSMLLSFSSMTDSLSNWAEKKARNLRLNERRKAPRKGV